MTSCDDDAFSLVADDNTYTTPTNHHNTTLHDHYAVATISHHKHSKAFCHRLSTKASPIIFPSLPTQNSVSGGSPKDITGEDDTPEGDDYSDGGGFCSQPDPKTNTPSFNMASVNPFATENEPDLVKCRFNPSIEKRINRDELSDNGTPQSYKKTRFTAPLHAGGGEYRKDREEWSDNAIAYLLDAYKDKFLELNKGNLRVGDWEEVAAIVSENCEKQKKSVEQCKNKVDNLKKRYKLERHRMCKGSISVSHWPWFQKLELIVSNSLPSKSVAADEDNSVAGSTNSFKHSKRYGTQTLSSATQINGLKSRQLANLRWRRVVFKISGAALGGTNPHNIDTKVAMLIAREVSIACRIGVEVAIVVGGGRNFFCGDTWVTTTGLDRSTAYQIGMMATVMNSILLQSALEKLGVQARVQTAFSLVEVAEPYNRQRAIRHLEKGRVVIFGGVGAGTGNPLFSTDTAAALRASEIHPDAVLKGTNVDGVYVCDSTNNDVVAEHISYRELASRGASAMDMMAGTFCEENGIPVLIFNLHEPGNISRALCGEQVGTLIDQMEEIG